MTRTQPLAVERYLKAWQHGDVKNADGPAPATMPDFTVYHSRPLGQGWASPVYSLVALIFVVVFVLVSASMPSVLRGASTFERFLLVSLLVLWCPGCLMRLFTAVRAARTVMYNRAFHPPLLLRGKTLHVGAHVRFWYGHQRRRQSDRRAGFVLSQLVAATHTERAYESDPYPAFEVLWSSDAWVTPITGGGAVSFEQDVTLPENLPGTGRVAASGSETFREVVWYLRVKEVLWPRSACAYEFVLPVEGRLEQGSGSLAEGSGEGRVPTRDTGSHTYEATG